MTTYNEQSDPKAADVFKEMRMSEFFELLDNHIKERIVKGDFDEVVDIRKRLNGGRRFAA